MPNLPEWLIKPPPQTVFDPHVGAPRRGRFVRRALGEFAGLLAGPFMQRDDSGRSGLLQELDPRAKALGLLGLIVLTTWLATWRALALDALICLVLVALSGIKLRRLAGIWLAVPLFSALLVIPATLNLIIPGEVLLPLWHTGQGRWGPWVMPDAVGVTDAGLEAGARFVTRSLLCVTLALILARTTRPDRLFRGLRALGVPKIFVMLLTMMERYVVVLVRSAEEIHLVKLSRTITPGSLRQEQAWVAAGAGSLFRRSRSLGNAVYLAMLSRGFTGDVHLLEEARFRLADAAFIAAAGAACAALLAVEG